VGDLLICLNICDIMIMCSRLIDIHLDRTATRYNIFLHGTSMGKTRLCLKNTVAEYSTFCLETL